MACYLFFVSHEGSALASPTGSCSSSAPTKSLLFGAEGIIATLAAISIAAAQLTFHMCMAVFTVDPENQAVLEFGQERVCVLRNGAISIEVDFLVRNIGTKPIRHLRIIFPYQFARLKKPWLWWRTEKSKLRKLRKWIEQVRQEEFEKMHPRTETFAEDAENWAYRYCDSLKIVQGSLDHIFALSRTNENGSSDRLEGVVRLGWELASPLPEFAWLILASRNFCLIDIVAPDNESPIQPAGRGADSSGWFRLRITVPKTNERFVLSDEEGHKPLYHQRLYSGAVTCGFLWNEAKNFREPTKEFPFAEGPIKIHSGKLQAEYLKAENARCDELDWRVLIYGEYRVVLNRPRHFGYQPFQPNYPRTEIAFPREAYPSGAVLGPWPIIRRFRPPRPTSFYDFGFGPAHGSDHLATPSATTEVFWTVALSVRLLAKIKLVAGLLTLIAAVGAVIYRGLQLAGLLAE